MAAARWVGKEGARGLRMEGRRKWNVADEEGFLLG